MNAENKLKRKRISVDKKLQSYFSEDNSPLFQAMRYAVFSGGKRYRPLLTLAAAECFGGEERKALPFACAIELIHNYSLVHDDLPAMDNDDFRRGKPSCHKAFGEDIALLVGDGLLTLAFEVLAEAPLVKSQEEVRNRIIAEVSHMAGVRGMIAGQFLDITLSPEQVTPDEFQELIFKKTGCLILAAVKTGAFLGGTTPPQMQAIHEYGRNVGLAFQTRDDILDTIEDAHGNEQARSNSVSLYGMEGAQKRLENYISRAIASLKEQSIESDELCYLANRLLVKEKGKGNVTNSG